jgi:hypothetical protein
VQTSGSPLADEKHAAAPRERLAKNIIAAGHRSDRDINKLVKEFSAPNIPIGVRTELDSCWEFLRKALIFYGHFSLICEKDRFDQLGG